MTDREALAEIIHEAILDNGWIDPVFTERAADRILARWRLAPRFKCAYKSAHEHAAGDATCCGLPVIPWEEESVR